MTVGSKEFYEVQAQFEKTFKHLRLDREAAGMNLQGAFYQSGEANNLFKAYMHGYAHAKCEYRQ